MLNTKRRPFGIASRAWVSVVIRLLLLSLLLVVALPTAAQEGVTDDRVNEVAKEVYCPVCENTPLDVCETKACADWRELIRSKLGEGQTKQQIFDYFATQYGDRVLASPPRQGFNLILWVFPILALLVGVVFFGRYMRNLREMAEQTTAPLVAAEGPSETHQPSETDYVARIEKELAERS